MKKGVGFLVSVSVAVLLVAAFSPLRNVKAAETNVRFCSSVSQLGPEVVVGQRFKVALVVEETQVLYGFDVQLNWTTQWIHCVSHVATVPYESYPAPIPPSPYGGILHSPQVSAKDVVDEEGGMPDADPGAMAWFVFASMLPANAFNGNGTVAVFEFEVTSQPIAPENAKILFHIIVSQLSNEDSTVIPCILTDLEIPLVGREVFNIKIESVSHAATVCYGHILYVYVNVSNIGPYSQNVTVVACANNVPVDTAYILLDGYVTNDTICTWDTTGYALGSYNISAHAVPVFGESDVTDNTINAAPATVKVIGDVDGDFDVDILDVVLITAIYMVGHSDPRFDERCDLDHDGTITIFDVVICTSYYGTKYP